MIDKESAINIAAEYYVVEAESVVSVRILDPVREIYHPFFGRKAWEVVFPRKVFEVMVSGLTGIIYVDCNDGRACDRFGAIISHE